MLDLEAKLASKDEMLIQLQEEASYRGMYIF